MVQLRHECKTLFIKITEAKRTGSMAPTVDYLLSKCKTLSSDFSITKAKMNDTSIKWCNCLGVGTMRREVS
jgi:hypothetical protein